MQKYVVLSIPLVLLACSSNDSAVGAAPDASRTDASPRDTGSGDPADGSSPDVSAADAQPDAANVELDAACPSSWTAAPAVDPSIAVPDGGGGVLLHAAATGTQDYTCMQVTVDGGSAYAWVFVGPEADLADCTAIKIGKHFASDGGAAAPAWQTNDGTFVVAKKVAANTPDGGAGAVPWLLLQEVSNGGTGPLAKVGYIQRVNTTGGKAPAAATCDANAAGTTQKIGYTGDYYFFGP